MPREAAVISLAADQAVGSTAAMKTVASMKRVSNHLTGAVDRVATLFRGIADGAKGHSKATVDHLADVSSLLDAMAFEGVE